MEIDWRRKAAVDIVNDLPEDIADAKKILEHAERFLDVLIADQSGDTPRQAAEVLPFRNSFKI